MSLSDFTVGIIEERDHFVDRVTSLNGRFGKIVSFLVFPKPHWEVAFRDQKWVEKLSVQEYYNRVDSLPKGDYYDPFKGPNR